MRKIYIFILSFIGMFCLSMPIYATYVQADTITKYTGTAGSLSWELDRTSGVFTISGDGAIPDYQTVRPLNPIYPSWYQYRNEIRTIEFEGNITTIGTYSFYDCNNLVSTNIPDSVTHIYNDAFRECDSLKNVTLGDNVQYFGDRVFYEIDGTVDVYITNINNLVKNISFGSQWYWYIYDARYHIVDEFNQTVSELKLSNDITAIRPYTFANFVDLEKIEFSNNITSIGRSAFESCDLIESIILPEGVKTIGVDAFSSCSRLSTLIIPSSVTSIGEDSFSKSISKIIYCGDETQWKELMGIPLWDVNPYNTYYHNYSISIHEPNCMEDGVKSYNCTICGKIETEILPALGHYVLQEQRSEVESIELINDSTYAFELNNGCYSSTNKINSSTSIFTIKGLYDCTLILKYSVSSEATYDKLIILHNATIKDTISGSVSEKTITITLSAGDFVYIKYAKDFSQAGGQDTSWFKIDSCTKTVIDTTVCIPVDEVEPTCEEAVVCASCCQTMKAALGHDEVQHEAKAPTCTEIGWDSYETCSRCDYTTYEEIPTNGHDYEAVVTAPT